MGATGGFMGGDPAQLRMLAGELHQAALALGGLGGRVAPLMAAAWRGPWEVVEEPLEAALRLAEETAKRLDAAQAGVVLRAKRIELAGNGDKGLQGAAAALFVPGASRLVSSAGGTLGARPKVTARARRQQGAFDAARVLDKLRSGLLNLAEPEAARKILATSVARARQEPAYAVGFLKRLGPKGLARLLDDGSLDPCALGEVVARASLVEARGEPQFGERFLDRALGKDKGRAAWRAAALGACECPSVAFHPAWTARMVEVLYRGPDISSRGDSRIWFRQTADRLITQLRPGGPSGPAAGLEAAAENALEELIQFAAEVDLSPAGRLALAGLLSEPESMRKVAEQLARRLAPGSPDEVGFNPRASELREVLAALGADPQCGPVLLDAAAVFAATRLGGVAGHYVDHPGEAAGREGLREVGALLGALTLAPYPDASVAVDAARAGRETVKGLLKSAAGAALKTGGAGLVLTVGVEGLHTVGFAFISGAAERDGAEERLRAEADGRKRRDILRDQLGRDLEHLAYASLLSDPAALSGLGVNLDPGAFPARLPVDPTTGRVDDLLAGPEIESTQYWKDLLFEVPGNEGHLTVPDPGDRKRWAAFRAWAKYVNPGLEQAVAGMHDEMMVGFNDQITKSA